MKDNYPIVVFWYEPDQEWIADIPDLKYCSASGDTPEEAIREVMIAREAWLDVAREDGAVLPDPRDSRFWPDIARSQFEDKVNVPRPPQHAVVPQEAGAA